MMSLLKSLLKC